MFKTNPPLLLLFAILFGSAGLQAQKISSPYSRFGIGDLYNSNNPVELSMGGTCLGSAGPERINFQNPASYTAFDTISFLFDGGMTSSFLTLKTKTLSQRSNFATLSNMLFGFPIFRWWKSSIGLVPFSQLGYKVSESQTDTIVGNSKRIFQGEGGLNQFYWGHAFKLSKRFSAGANVTYLFGTLDKTRSLTYPDSVQRFSTRIINSTSVGDFMFTLGMRYTEDFGKNYRFGAGLAYTRSSSVRTREYSLWETYISGSTGIVYVKDTIELVPEVEDKMVLPAAYGFGISLEKKDVWCLLADLKFQDWSKYSYRGEKDSLNNSLRASVGFQIIPDNKTTASYLKKINYRLGFRYSNTYLQLRNNQLKELAIGFGVGLPLSRSRSKINIGMEIGKRGTTDSGLIQENFFRFSLGVTVFEHWFIRKKFE